MDWPGGTYLELAYGAQPLTLYQLENVISGAFVHPERIQIRQLRMEVLEEGVPMDLEKIGRDLLKRLEGLNNIHDDDVRREMFEVIMETLEKVKGEKT